MWCLVFRGSLRLSMFLRYFLPRWLAGTSEVATDSTVGLKLLLTFPRPGSRHELKEERIVACVASEFVDIYAG